MFAGGQEDMPGGGGGCVVREEVENVCFQEEEMGKVCHEEKIEGICLLGGGTESVS